LREKRSHITVVASGGGAVRYQDAVEVRGQGARLG
jgi:hypothetical protein